MSQLEALAQHQEAILLAEIGAWLHMLGKYDWRFIQKHCGGANQGDNNYDYQRFMPELTPRYPHLFELLNLKSVNYQGIFSSLPITAPSNAGVFIRDHREIQEARADRCE